MAGKPNAKMFKTMVEKHGSEEAQALSVKARRKNNAKD